MDYDVQEQTKNKKTESTNNLSPKYGVGAAEKEMKRAEHKTVHT